MKKIDILIIISLFLTAFLIRFAGIANIPLYLDEWNYWVKTNEIIAGNFIPRMDVFVYSPPFLSYIGAVVTFLFEGDLDTLRTISVIFGSLTVPLLYLFGKAVYNRRAGLLAALLICFSPYHILYSRIYMLEALTLFFIIAFLLFLWLSQSEHKIKYAYIAGAMLGLAIDAKYVSLFLIPAVLFYIFLANNFSFKALINKEIILMFFVAFLFFLPVLISLYYSGVGLQPFYFYSIGQFDKQIPVGLDRAIDKYALDELIIRGVDKSVTVLFTWGDWTLNGSAYIFKLSAVLLFLITIIYYLYNSLSRDKRNIFLISQLIILEVFLLGIGRLQHYLIYTQPFIFIMASNLAVKAFDDVKRENSHKNIFRIFIILLVIVVTLFLFKNGITSNYWDKGDYDPWVIDAVDFIKNDMDIHVHRPVLVGVVSHYTIVLDYYFKTKNIDASMVNLMKPTSKYANDIAEIDLEKIDILKPDYILMSRAFYNNYFKANKETIILKDYILVYTAPVNFNTGYVYRRTNIQSLELASQVNGTFGEISRYTFERSIPNVMQKGDVYTILVDIKNTGNLRTNYSFTVRSDKYKIYLDNNKKGQTISLEGTGIYLDANMGGSIWQKVELDGGSSQLFQFKVLPFKKSTDEIPIVVDLYETNDKNETYIKVDSLKKNVSRIY